MNELRDRLRELFPPDTGADWADVLRRARRRGGRVPRLLLPLAAAVLAVLVVGSALALTGRLGGLLHGTPVTDLTPQERFVLSELDMKGKVELIATHGSRTFYVIRRRDGGLCYAVGERRLNATPAQAALRTRFGAIGCTGRGMFPSRALPVLDFSSYRLKRGEGSARLMGLEGFAADPVARIGVIGSGNRIVYSARVDDNVYSARNTGVTGARGIVALDDEGKALWVQCTARGGCGKYKSSPPPPPARPPAKLPPPAPSGPAVVQRGTANGVSVAVRGAEVTANFAGVAPRVERLLRGKSGEIVLGCFRLVTVGGKRFQDGIATSTPFAAIVRIRFSSPHGAAAAPFDGCTAAGRYGHRWNDAHGTRDLVEVPLTARGRRFFVERAVARDLAWLARARVFRNVRYTRGRPSAALVAPRLAHRVVPLARPSETPPLGRLGLWLGPNRRVVLVERASTGRRLYLELRHGVVYRTNLIGLASVL
jgi:hypothetical protein